MEETASGCFFSEHSVFIWVLEVIYNGLNYCYNYQIWLFLFIS